VETIGKIRAYKETEVLVRYVRERVEDEYAVLRSRGEGVMDEMELRVWLRSV
jgi:hypothetical protein